MILIDCIIFARNYKMSKKDKEFIKQLVESFPNKPTKDCLSISKKSVDYIQDGEDNERCYFTDRIDNGFKIINSKNKSVNLFATDDCFFSGKVKNLKKCDGIIFDDKELCFFELKLKMTTKNEQTKQERYTDAIEQLESTISFFQNNKINYNSLIPQAYICMFNEYYPTNRTSTKYKREKFFERNNVSLHNKNTKEFK